MTLQYRDNKNNTLSLIQYLLRFIAHILSRSRYITSFSREIVRHHDNDAFADISSNGEKKVIQFMTNLNKSGCFADIGFNKGDYSKEILNEGFYGKLLIVDPLESNITSPLPDTTAEIIKAQVALLEEIGESVIYHNIDEELSGTDSLIKQIEYSEVELEYQEQVKFEDRTTLIPVKVDTLDSLAMQLKLEYFNFIKIDVEGAELAVLKGAESLISEGKIDYIQLEFGHACRAARTTLFDIYRFLAKYNYQMYVIKPGGIELTSFSPWLENRYSYINLFFAKKELRDKLTDLEYKSSLI